MTFDPRMGGQRAASVSVYASRLLPNRYDLLVLAVAAGMFVAAASGARQMHRPLEVLAARGIDLAPAHLPGYALLTSLRMFAAMALSVVFTFVVATLAAKSRKAEMVIIPALDILQSVPVLGFLTFTVVLFTGLFPGSQIGLELAAVFAIFTSQAWNMTFSFYQSLRTVPRDLDEVARHFRLSGWQRFWTLEAPFAMPGFVWNAMMSMSGGWFFVVASEAIAVGDTKFELPGIGSYIAHAIEVRDLAAIAWAVATMAVVIGLYDQLMFRPIVAWADKFRAEQTAAQIQPRSWVLDLIRRTRLIRRLAAPLGAFAEAFGRLVSRAGDAVPVAQSDPRLSRVLDRAWTVAVIVFAAWGLWEVAAFARQTLGMDDLIVATQAGLATFVRVVVLIALASLIWVPIGVWIGLRPAWAEKVQPIAQFMAAFPANVLFPFVVVAIAATGADANIWLSPLMVLGTQWYILFNVIAGASTFPTELREVAGLFRLSTVQWWTKAILPGIFPYYVTGALTASGGSWNAAIVAEVASWGDTRLEAFGLGSYIANASTAGDFHRVVLGIAVMAAFVVLINRVLWRRLYLVAERKLRL